ncbi:dTMP kinase [Marinobacter xiaoshiensis]|uniref:Thymidylate kinase n=1 Tax=Marinobacter xiaoshiensis TaxID=3073652 RepID=A0ABU2HLG9_9GAMM|nr:dTMP kinase [Marinobacter sp. F60267]MDS1311495.1 dTMP kinase [Marinobacter sp. F60267]
MSRLIAIEGIDGSGKNTQTELLLSRLNTEGKKAKKISFPCYSETFFGKEVGRYLNGEFGSLDQVHPKLAAMLYAGDRYEKCRYIRKLLSEDVLVIADRYVPSNIAHQSVKVATDVRDEFSKWVEDLEYEIYKMPKPDLVVFLDVPPGNSQELILMKEKRDYTEKARDLHEEDEDYLKKVYKCFLDLSAKPGWTKIECSHEGRLRSVDSIFVDLWETVSQVINK